MTSAQNALYFRAWSAAKKAGGLTEADRHQLHIEALGQDKSSRDFTNADLDKVLAAFRAISQPHSLNAQLRQLDQPRARLLARIRAQMRILALFREWPESYLARILQDRFSADAITDLTAELYSRPSAHGPAGEPITDSQLTQVRNTLDRCLARLRQSWNDTRARGERPKIHHNSPLAALLRQEQTGTAVPALTEHDTCQLAQVACFRPKCAQCRESRAASTASTPEPAEHFAAAAAGPETTEPF